MELFHPTLENVNILDHELSHAERFQIALGDI